jgi:NAD(P)H dehydrogenase (quinone)
MLVVTGATGALGRAIIHQLLVRGPASSVVASVQDPNKVADFTARGVAVRRADFTDSASLARAFEGATKVLVISLPLPTHIAVPLHRAAIEAAKAGGVQRIYYTSQMGADPRSAFAPMHTHAATEEMLAACGVPFTAFRNGFYASSALAMFGRGLKAGEIRAPEDGPIAWTTHADLAEGIATAMTSDGLDGVTPVLTGSDALTLEQVCAMASAVSGQHVRRTVVTDDNYRAQLIAAGVPEIGAAMTLGVIQAARAGGFAKTDPTLGRLIGHPPTDMKHVLRGFV